MITISHVSAKCTLRENDAYLIKLGRQHLPLMEKENDLLMDGLYVSRNFDGRSLP